MLKKRANPSSSSVSMSIVDLVNIRHQSNFFLNFLEIDALILKLVLQI